MVEEIYLISKNFPTEEKYALTSQLRRSANSIIANFAESYGRYFYKDKIRVLYIARAEAEETWSHLLIAKKLLYLDKEKHKELDKKYNHLIIDINKMIIKYHYKNKNKKGL